MARIYKSEDTYSVELLSIYRGFEFLSVGNVLFFSNGSKTFAIVFENKEYHLFNLGTNNNKLNFIKTYKAQIDFRQGFDKLIKIIDLIYKDIDDYKEPEEVLKEPEEVSNEKT